MVSATLIASLLEHSAATPWRRQASSGARHHSPKSGPIHERLKFSLRFDANNFYKYHSFNPPNSTYNATDPSNFGTFNGTRGSFSDIGTGRWHGIMVFRVMW